MATTTAISGATRPKPLLALTINLPTNASATLPAGALKNRFKEPAITIKQAMRFKSGAAVCILSASLLLAGCADHPISQLHVVSNFLTSEENVVKGIRTPMTAFTSKDVIVYFIDFQWDDATRGFGGHEVKYNWYAGDKLISTGHHGQGFDHAPLELWGRRSASSLGTGHFKVDAFVDDTLVASKEFDINP